MADATDAVYRGTKLTNQTAYDEIQKILAVLPDEDARQLVLTALLIKRCRTCLAYDLSGSRRRCHELRGR